MDGLPVDMAEEDVGQLLPPSGNFHTASLYDLETCTMTFPNHLLLMARS